MVRMKVSIDKIRKKGVYFRNTMEEFVMVRIRSEKKVPTSLFC